MRVAIFLEALSQAHRDLANDLARKALEDCIETLSKVRNHGPGKTNKGLILLDQYFSVPQIGEVIRDMLILQHLALSLDR